MAIQPLEEVISVLNCLGGRTPIKRCSIEQRILKFRNLLIDPYKQVMQKYSQTGKIKA
jgi:hypothetical protein